MFCSKCGAEIPDDSVFCSKCGQKQGEEASEGEPQAQPSPQKKPEEELVRPQSEPGPHGPEKEEEVWRGKWSAKALMLHFVGLALLLVLVCVGFFLWSDQWSGVKWVGLVVFGVPFLLLMWKVLKMKLTLRYRLTTQRLFVDRGFIRRRLDEVELVRVDDVRVEQDILARLFGVGHVSVTSTDASDPNLILFGIREPVDVKEKVRELMKKHRERSVYLETL